MLTMDKISAIMGIRDKKYMFSWSRTFYVPKKRIYDYASKWENNLKKVSKVWKLL